MERDGTRPRLHRSRHFDRTELGEVPPRAEVPHLLQRGVLALESLKSQWRRGMRLGTHERMALGQLWVSGPLQISQLGGQIALSPAAMTSLVDRLVADGYVRRVGDPRDRRRVVLELTDRALPEIERMRAGFDCELVQYVEGLGDDEWAAVAGFLDLLHDAARREAEQLRAHSDLELRALATDDATTTHDATATDGDASTRREQQHVAPPTRRYGPAGRGGTTR